MRTWLVTVILMAVALSPMLSHSATLEDPSPLAQSSPLQVSLSATSGWTSGGEDLTITGSGFRGMADRNVTYDGLTSPMGCIEPGLEQPSRPVERHRC